MIQMAGVSFVLLFIPVLYQFLEALCKLGTVSQSLNEYRASF
jgi:hypothetical protein